MTLTLHVIEGLNTVSSTRDEDIRLDDAREKTRLEETVTNSKRIDNLQDMVSKSSETNRAYLAELGSNILDKFRGIMERTTSKP